MNAVATCEDHEDQWCGLREFSPKRSTTIWLAYDTRCTFSSHVLLCNVMSKSRRFFNEVEGL